MDRTFRPFSTGSDADTAFAVVVLASYFTTFSTVRTASAREILLMIGLGVAYIAIGIYGYSLSARTGKLPVFLAYFAFQLMLAGSIVFLGKGAGYNAMVLLPLVGHSVMLLPRNWRFLVNLAILGVYAGAMLLVTQDLQLVWSGMPVFVAGQIFIIVFTQMAVSEEKARGEVEQLVSELEEANQQLREYAVKIEELAITRERNRMAREIHDGVGHYLTTIFMQIQAARAVMASDSHKAQEALGRAQNMTQEALVDIRQSVAALRDMPVDSQSLQDEVKKLLAGCEVAGIVAEMKVVGAPRELSTQAMMTVFRAVQEGVNNTCKHARAERLSVTMDYSQVAQFHLVIQDDGIGSEKIDGGFGLLGMRERVRMLDGSMRVDTAPGQGFRLEVSVPG